ncbi:hypothetical protein DFQ28_004185 [Apophysomyces sp. BC1034]|nr:hypothetical protein DFQ30_005994 [Apophysomyces sp. BC1015]KAG0177605.1 hypothetical protein DFQ29_004657 [Apophysomyces sp. BC1021]KAG0188907.1 hypothetical protein DFQ28_004185 [Apophysomyces sp. BC1034]
MKLASLATLLLTSSVLADKALVGYFPNWLYATWPLTNIDFNKYTHINYAFAIMYQELSPVWPDDWSNRHQMGELVSAAHASNTKVLISIGGWSGCLTFSPMVASPDGRTQFINWVTTQLDSTQADGVDIDWEYPGKVGAGCNQFDIEHDRGNYLTLIQELRSELDKKFGEGKKEISIAAHVRTFVTPDGYMADVSEFAKVIDRFNVMTYDINGAWNSTSGPNAPFNFEPGFGDADSYVSGIENWMKAGVPASKIVPGLAFYGRSSKLVPNRENTGTQYQAQKAGDVPHGDSHDANWQDAYCYKDPASLSGVWRYGNLRSQGVLTTPTTASAPWVRTWDNITQTPWLVDPGNNIFISYDDPKSIGIKVDHALCLDLGGVMVWSVDEDTTDGELLTVAHRIRTDSKPAVCPQ